MKKMTITSIYNHYYVYNEKGNLLGDVDLYRIDVLELSPSNVCLIKETFIDNSDLREYTIVSFTDDSTGIKEVSSEKKLAFAYPNPLPSGRDFIIKLDSPSEDNMILIVSDMNGRIVYHSKIKLAETKVRIPASCNLRGSYVFSIEKDGVIVEKGKILAH